MSIFGSMKTAVSGMNAQANRLGTVSDNIANANTTGYKEASTSFSSLVLPSSNGSYNSGGVETTVHYAISQQGDVSYTTSNTDLAIQGNGFFVVQGASGQTFLTRAGDFSPDDQGNLVNSAGFTLMGYPYGSGSPSVVVNGFSGLVPINVSQNGVTAIASSQGSLEGNLDSNSALPDASDSLPSDNASDGSTTANYKKTSIIAYDSQGNAITYDVYFTKTADGDPAAGTPDTWDVAVFNQADAATGDSPFPYSSGPVTSGTMNFDSDGNLISSGGDEGTITASSPLTLTNGSQTISLDMSGFTQVATDFNATGKMNGQAPNPVTDVKIDKDGTVTAQYKDGSSKSLYRVPLATVASPDNLTLESGNVYSANGQSGVTVTGFPQTGGFGYIQSGALEESNVDLASELTNMIEAQKSYTANSKVFQAGSDLLDVLVNLQR
ncbi:flagellar hook protein FlgE [Rhizobium sp. BK313]|uniref:flagellar hook protein FlgE n=1 Tax=Rhizobium sp. BK313 TaxID=2587081 RepID=UPI00105E613E|nr:flagellar hook protein FlgE [Rhizobium sp. BK313]MBB3455707.1 flagellar hook protein FlgE [Rhizobium sp. BK313]